MFDRARLRPGETLLVQGGTSGIGVTAIQLAKAAGATVIVTAGSDDKCAACIAIGADHAINYKTQDFVAETKRLTGGRGANLPAPRRWRRLRPVAGVPRLLCDVGSGAQGSLRAHPAGVRGAKLNAAQPGGSPDSKPSRLRVTAITDGWQGARHIVPCNRGSGSSV